MKVLRVTQSIERNFSERRSPDVLSFAGIKMATPGSEAEISSQGGPQLPSATETCESSQGRPELLDCDMGKPKLLNCDNAFTEFLRILKISRESIAIRPTLFSDDSIKAIGHLEVYRREHESMPSDLADSLYALMPPDLAKRVYILHKRIHNRLKNYKVIDDTYSEQDIAFWHKEVNYFLRALYRDVHQAANPPPPMTEEEERDLMETFDAYQAFQADREPSDD